MIAPNSASMNATTAPRQPIDTWEDEGGAIPSIATIRQWQCQANVGDTERIVSAIAGGALLLHGAVTRSLCGLATSLVGGGLLYRAVTGHCHLYHALNISTADERQKMALGCGQGSSQASRPRESAITGSGAGQATSQIPGTQQSGATQMPSRVPDRKSETATGTPPQGRT